jgi:glycosyltransferase involved in cell wall biosynthesis
MESYKGLDILLDAGALLSAADIPVTIILAGRGPELSRLRSRLQDTNYTEVIDRYLSPDEAISEIQQAQIVVAPYTDATQSGVVAAAYAGGRPVVASRIGGLEESVEDQKTGLLVAPNDASALAIAIRSIVENPKLWSHLAEGALNASEGTHSWVAISDQLMGTYDSLRNHSSLVDAITRQKTGSSAGVKPRTLFGRLTGRSMI